MLSIFALDPAIGGSFQSLRYCIEHCGSSKGRGIADLPPRQWCDAVRQAIDSAVSESELGSVRGQSMKRWLGRVRGRLVDRAGTDWDYAIESWVTNTLREHRRKPFSAIVSHEFTATDEVAGCYNPDELHEGVPTWETPCGCDITRSPGAFVDAVVPVVVVSSEVHFVDRGFSVDADALHTRNYQEILRRLNDEADVFPAVTIHCCPDAGIAADYFSARLTELYADIIPAGKNITCVMWQVDGFVERGAHPFHNRFVVTKKFGLTVGYGTDAPRRATASPDFLLFLDDAMHADKLSRCRKREFTGVTVAHEFVVASTL